MVNHDAGIFGRVHSLKLLESLDMNGPTITTRTADISPTLLYRSQMARQRAKRAVLLARAANEASRELNRKLDGMLVQLEFRFVVERANGELKQLGLELIAKSLKKNGTPSKDAMLSFISEAKKTA
jgi:hypothetical protein